MNWSDTCTIPLLCITDTKSLVLDCIVKTSRVTTYLANLSPHFRISNVTLST